MDTLKTFEEVDQKIEKKFNIAPQTKIAFIGYILLIVAQLIFIYKQPNNGQYTPNIVAFVILAALGLYIINCTVVGHCHIYAYIIGYLIVAVAVLAVFGLVYMMMKE
jgi:hypothetical protein